ncbi:MAG: DUF5110 domain-containing protein [Clostridia bacterium]|nr:DUF5110 domain-containing protein [Clostridia bacterium]
MMNSIYKYTFGTPEEHTPFKLTGQRIDGDAGGLPACEAPFGAEAITFSVNARGTTLNIPAAPGEQFFGLGLQLKSVAQRGKKKVLRVNSDPTLDLGDSHAPVPFYLSTAGYGVLIDTARYTTFQFASHVKQASAEQRKESADNTDDLYAARALSGTTHVLVDIPAAKGVDVYVFAGPTMADALKRYNMFSGGGVLPPMWGLGIWYRTWVYSTQDAVREQAKSIRADRLPCDVFGLEPGWQTRAYSCSYVWNREKYPDIEQVIEELRAQGYHLNLWEHLYMHPECPIYGEQEPYAGDYKVWGGLVPDLSVPEAAKSFRDYHKTALIEKGISGFKLDECDNSDFIGHPWSYPEASQFPSGMDGEQMHSMMGMLSQQAMMPVYEELNQRTYNCVRSSGAYAAPMPYVLYSDLYSLSDFIRGVVTAGFSGLLWCPEVRQSGDEEDLIRRLQTVVLSPLAMINNWMVPHPAWKQFDTEKNKEGDFSGCEGVVDRVRPVLELRMKLLPYLYNAFNSYRKCGLPPFRSLAVDYTGDANTHTIDDQYMVGDAMMYAPMLPGKTSREVYLPAGKWHNFFTGETYEGATKRTFEAAVADILLFVRDGSLIPTAKPVTHVTPDTVFEMEVRRFGGGRLTCTLTEDDGESFDFLKGEQNIITLTSEEDGRLTLTREGGYDGVRYVF